jgi:hypothetical protein
MAFRCNGITYCLVKPDDDNERFDGRQAKQKEKGRAPRERPLILRKTQQGLIRSPCRHATTAVRHCWCFRLRLRSYHGLSGNEETGDGGRILQCRAHDLGRIDDALFYEVAIFAGLGV